MKRYLLSYLAAYVASLAAFGVIMVIAISNWFFTDSPLWFDVLGVIVTALPALARSRQDLCAKLFAGSG